MFVFPSRTDTFGLVLLEAMACGVPVAAYPVTGPIDVVVDGVTGVLREDLREAALSALRLSPDACRAHALTTLLGRCDEPVPGQPGVAARQPRPSRMPLRLSASDRPA